MKLRMRKMEKNQTINVLIVVLCILLIGFVYINGRMIDDFQERKTKETFNIENQRLPMK
ncbi:MAG: hypothetical protein WD048_08200 [Chitinophagales bacterium]